MAALAPVPASSARDVLSALSAAGISSPAGSPKAGVEARARDAAVEFESVFLSSMFKEMFSGIKTDGPFGGGYGEEVFRDMLADEYAGNVARVGGIGLADQVYREILALQEVQGQ